MTKSLDLDDLPYEEDTTNLEPKLKKSRDFIKQHRPTTVSVNAPLPAMFYKQQGSTLLDLRQYYQNATEAPPDPILTIFEKMLEIMENHDMDDENTTMKSPKLKRVRKKTDG